MSTEMEKRKYTVAEMERMRMAIRCSYPSWVPFDGDERRAEIEHRLRVYMLNGTEPEELEAVAKRRFEFEDEFYGDNHLP